MLQRRMQQMRKAFCNQNKSVFLTELEAVKHRAQLSDREIYNSLKTHIDRESWGLLRNWIFNADMSAKGGEQ